jgi:hypothetical protein
MDRHTFIAAVILGILAAPGAAWAQTFAPEALARDFRIDFQAHPDPKGTVIDGYVYNQARMSAGRMTLRIEQLDAAGNVVRSTVFWVFGEVRSGGRTYFRSRVPDAPSYRVRVESFEWVGCGDA